MTVREAGPLRDAADTRLGLAQSASPADARSARESRRSRGSLLDLIKGQDADQGSAQSATTAQGVSPLGNLPPRPGQVRGYQQLVDSHGHILFRSSGNVTLPVDARTRALASYAGKRYFTDAEVNGLHVRILAEHIAPGRAVQVAQQLTEVDNLLSRLRLILALLDIGGIALAALLGRLVAGAAVLPLKRLTQATEHVALTQDLSGRIKLTGVDELGRLASSFNAMLDALEHSMGALDASVHAQRQLVADASHELRTPVTSLRTNIEILQQAQEMEPDERQRLLADVVEQIGELTLLMNDLIELARGEEPSADTEDLRLDVLVSDVTERTRRHSPGTPLLPRARADARRGRARTPGARRHEPARQRGQVQPARQAGRDLAVGRRADRARPRAGDLRGGLGTRVRPLLPRRRGPRASRLGAGVGDRAPGGSSARWNRHRRTGGGGRDADASAPARRRSSRTGASHAGSERRSAIFARSVWL